MNQSQQRKFYCYNAKLRKFLDQNGTRWIDKGIHYRTHKPFWVFEQTARLGRLLDEYKQLNKYDRPTL